MRQRPPTMENEQGNDYGPWYNETKSDTSAFSKTIKETLKGADIIHALKNGTEYVISWTWI